MNIIKKYVSTGYIKIYLSVLFIIALIVLIFIKFFYKSAEAFLLETLSFSIKNLGISAGVKILCESFDFLKGFVSLSDKIFNFLLITNALIVLQITLLKISNFIFLKILITIVFVLSYFKIIRKIMIRILILLLFINPGLPVYISLVKIMSNSVSLETGKNIESKFNDFKSSLQGKSIDKTEESKLQNDNANKSLFEKAGELINSAKERITDSINLMVERAGKALNAIFEVIISYFITILVLFIIMPFLYFYILYHLFKNILENIK